MEYLRRWPWIQDRVQTWIKDLYHGEMLVGQAFSIGLGDDQNTDAPILVVAPPMRVPMVLPANTINPYLAAKAVFKDYLGLEESRCSLAMPGLGTGVGRVPADVCARQVRQAFFEVVLEQYRPPSSWQECAWRQQCLISGREY